jgi:hypothetical protein
MKSNNIEFTDWALYGPVTSIMGANGNVRSAMELEACSRVPTGNQ